MTRLEIILNRILPLRKSVGQEDVIVFLGDYIDGGDESDKVIDCLINIKAEYGDRAIILKGAHEELLLKARNSEHDFTYWIDNGGIQTISAYTKRANLNTSPHSIKRNRLHDIIPESHLNFITGLDYKRILDDYCFFHGGFDSGKSIDENFPSNFLFDYSSSRYIKECVRAKKQIEFKDDYIYIAHHNYKGKKPYIHPRYMMLEGLWPKKLIVMDLNSMKMAAVSQGKSRLYPLEFDIQE